MADYYVIYDPKKETAAIVDSENRIAFGPAMIGPDAEEILDAFLMSVPYDVAEVSSAVLRDWFEKFAQSYLQARQAEAAAPGDGQVEPRGRERLADEVYAEMEAREHFPEPPAPQPADTDMEADTRPQDSVNPTPSETGSVTASNGDSTPPYTGLCFACDGKGTIVMVAGEPAVLCSACRGTGRLPAPVQT